MATTTTQKQAILMKRLGVLLSHDLGYIWGERESGPNGEKKEFQDARHFWRLSKNDKASRQARARRISWGGVSDALPMYPTLPSQLRLFRSCPLGEHGGNAGGTGSRPRGAL